MWVYSPIPCVRDTPCFSATPLTPLLSGLYLWPPDPQPVKPRPVLMESAPSRSSQQELPRPEEEIHRIDTATAEAQQLQRKYLIAP